MKEFQVKLQDYLRTRKESILNTILEKKALDKDLETNWRRAGRVQIHLSMISLREFESPMSAATLPDVKNEIHLVRGQRVMLDSALAEIYGVPTKRLNQQVRRNRKKFPADFAFQLDRRGVCKLEVANCDFKFRGSKSEGNLRSQFVTSKPAVAEISRGFSPNTAPSCWPPCSTARWR